MLIITQKRVNWLKRMVYPLINPSFMVKGIKSYLWYFSDWYKYTRMPQAERIYWSDANPQLHDRVETTSIDPHYFYCNGWAMRRIMLTQPSCHIDIGSQTIFANLLGAVIPTIFVDYCNQS